MALAAAGMLVLAAAGNGHAADGKQLATDSAGPSGNPDWTCTYGSANGQACFAPLGEWFKIRDTMVDGYPVVIQWRFFDDEVSPTGAVVREGTIWNTAGEAAGWRYVNKSFPESDWGVTLKSVFFRACSSNYNNNSVLVHTCSEWESEYT
ncbi:hypothetical protein [Streptomyces sp. NPDC048584]|uniref:hypothetical protein n=1 Tax=Streptomyces sp. NPDC048584 TaxID=3365573 RepID=UPI003723724E